jgi:hypothetical protein
MLVSSPLMCPLWACSSNLCMWTRLCCSWNRYGTTSKHSQQYQRRYKSRWLHKDGCGLFTATLTQFLIFGASYIGTFHLLLPWSNRSVSPLQPILFYCFLILFNTLLFLGALSHYRAMTTDPGAVPEGSLPLPSDFVSFARKKQDPRLCERSGVYKPPRAHFDSGVSRQVVKMDHHCPWVNNCVGINNQKFFILFCMYVGTASFTALFMLAMYFFSSCKLPTAATTISNSVATATTKRNYHTPCSLPPLSILFLVLLSVESTLFGLFTSCMFGDQMHSIASNQTYIDRLKEKRNQGSSPEDMSNSSSPCLNYKSPFILHLREVVGDANIFIWFLPILPYWNDRDELFGFCQPGSKLGRETKLKMLSRHDSEELPEEDDLEW